MKAPYRRRIITLLKEVRIKSDPQLIKVVFTLGSFSAGFIFCFWLWNLGSSKQQLRIYSDRAWAWYQTQDRELPWRQTTAPYPIWVSEIMLQQTKRENFYSQIPMREPSSPLPHKQIGVAVIWNDQGEILIDRRPQDGLLGGLWEFPGGKIEANETIPDCIQREIREELGIGVEVGDHLITINHAYTHFRVTLNVYHCRYAEGEPQPIECDEIRWVKPKELSQFPFPKANTKIIDAILN